MDWITHTGLPRTGHWLPTAFRWGAVVTLCAGCLVFFLALLDLVLWPVAFGALFSGVAGWMTSSAISLALECAIYVARSTYAAAEESRQRYDATQERLEKIEKRVTAARDLLVSRES